MCLFQQSKQYVKSLLNFAICGGGTANGKPRVSQYVSHNLASLAKIAMSFLQNYLQGARTKCKAL